MSRNTSRSARCELSSSGSVAGRRVVRERVEHETGRGAARTRIAVGHGLDRGDQIVRARSCLVTYPARRRGIVAITVFRRVADRQRENRVSGCVESDFGDDARAAPAPAWCTSTTTNVRTSARDHLDRGVDLGRVAGRVDLRRPARRARPTEQW